MTKILTIQTLQYVLFTTEINEQRNSEMADSSRYVSSYQILICMFIHMIRKTDMIHKYVTN